MKDLLSAGKGPAQRAALQGADSRSFAPRHGPGAAAGRVRRVAQDDRRILSSWRSRRSVPCRAPGTLAAN